MSDDRAFVRREHHRMTEGDIIAGFCHSVPRVGMLTEGVKQANAYRSGQALAGHIKVAHNGIEDPNCPACKEIKFRCGL